MSFLSIIIPIYNVEKYLRQCIDSVLEQKLDDYELILVDDGSPDQCPQICDEYGKVHEEIKVIHKLNSGLSGARNAGINAASGRYLMFMDSDDWWDPEVNVKKTLEKVRETEDVDMFLFCSKDFIEGAGYFKRKEHRDLSVWKTDSVESYYQSLLDNGNLEVSACTKIINAEFLRKNELFFRDGILGEDNEWMIRVLRSLKRVKVIPEYLYVCRGNRNGSITQTIKRKNIEDLLQIIQESIDYHECHPESKLKPYEYCFDSYLWFSALGLSSLIPEKDRKQLRDKFKRTNEVCHYSNSKKTKLSYTVYRILGLELTTKILGFYIDLKNRKLLNKVRI